MWRVRNVQSMARVIVETVGLAKEMLASLSIAQGAAIEYRLGGYNVLWELAFCLNSSI